MRAGRWALPLAGLLSLACGGLFVNRSGLANVRAALAHVDPESAVPLFVQGSAESRSPNPVCAGCLEGLASVDPSQRAVLAAHALFDAQCLCPTTCASEVLPSLAGAEPAARLQKVVAACDAKGPDPLFTGPTAELRAGVDPLDYTVVRMLVEAMGTDDPEYPALAEQLAVGLALQGWPSLQPTPSPLVVGAPDTLLTDRVEGLRACGQDVAHRLIVAPTGVVAGVLGEGACVNGLLRPVTLDPADHWRLVDLTWAASAFPPPAPPPPEP